jgi:hypothetical protein
VDALVADVPFGNRNRMVWVPWRHNENWQALTLAKTGKNAGLKVSYGVTMLALHGFSWL